MSQHSDHYTPIYHTIVRNNKTLNRFIKIARYHYNDVYLLPEIKREAYEPNMALFVVKLMQNSDVCIVELDLSLIK